jgi:DNA repair exonuclease SbcCD ATPase subunit
MEINQKSSRKTVINPEGSIVLERKPEIQAYLSSANLRLKSDCFYQDAPSKLKEILELGSKIDEDYILGLAKFLADKGLKLSPVILLSILSDRKYSFRNKNVKYIFNTPARIAEAIAINNLKLPRYTDCPSCGEHLIEKSGSLVIFDDESAEAVRKSKEDELKKQSEEAISKINDFTVGLSKAGDIDSQIEKLSDEKAALKSDFLVTMQRQKTLEAQLAAYKQIYEAHQGAKEQVAKVTEQISTLEGQIAETNSLMLSHEDTVKTLAAAKQVLSPMGAIAYSLDAIMDEINEEVTYYLDIFSHGTMAYKMSSGNDKAKIVHNITHDGENVSVGSLSGGEERGLILSVDLGLSEVLAKKCGVPLPSILLLDECFDGLDYVGKEKVLDSLKELSESRCIIIVDHSTEWSALFNKRIRVVKSNGISTVEVE